MKILILIAITILLFGAFMIISNNNLYLSRPSHVSLLTQQYKIWLTNILETGKTITAQIIGS
jgi:hypothetical protein